MAAIWVTFTEDTPMDNAPPPSANEAIKSNSRYLRGTIADGLTRVETGSLSDDDQQLTKFHGIYVQDDRDLRAERGRKKMEKAFIFMVRLRVPGGILTPTQWLRRKRSHRSAAMARSV
jgi:sulfite reductase (NADPH) hemoprotein beta-component